MILVDTSIWADHFRRADAQLIELLRTDLVLVHPFVTGEVAMGNLRDWELNIAMLRALPQAKIALEREMLRFVAAERLTGTGIGFVDAHLLASCRLNSGTLLWSRDKRLEAHAKTLNLNWGAA